MKLVRKNWALKIAAMREARFSDSGIKSSVREIIGRVQAEGDKILIELTNRFDKVSLTTLRVPQRELNSAANELPSELRNSINIAAENIDRFHAAQNYAPPSIEVQAGVKCWQKLVPLDAVGLYVPGGSAPLISTVLMLAIPARIAGCRRIVLCTPPDKQGAIPKSILYAAKVCGVEEIYTVGGAQAIAALAYGTESIPRVDKIFGPGNTYVTTAKQLLLADGTVAIDLPAGPSELAVIVDAGADPEFVAADLLAQAEHDPLSQVLLFSNDSGTIARIMARLDEQLKELPRREIASAALGNSVAFLVPDLDTAIDLANCYGPEHLQLMVSEPERYVERVSCAGSVFLGYYSAEAFGDYASGTNHTLPTGGAARAWSGVELRSFQRCISVQKIEPEGLLALAAVVENLALAEGLYGHANSVAVRRKQLEVRDV
ncbi:MAG: histidinol dehydrogenase [Bdellovibrionales bacterium]|nr:histidinol dehydrogenase [Bdellovibrionales bacterium]